MTTSKVMNLLEQEMMYRLSEVSFIAKMANWCPSANNNYLEFISSVVYNIHVIIYLTLPSNADIESDIVAGIVFKVFMEAT